MEPDEPRPTLDRSPIAVPPRAPHPISHPSRWPVLAGFVLLFASALGPWAIVYDPFGFVAQPLLYAQSTDGAAIIILAALLVGLVVSTTVAESDLRILQFLPATLGLACLFLDDKAFRAAQGFGGAPGATPAYWANISGALLVAVGGTATTLVLRRRDLEADAARAALGFGTAEEAATAIVAGLVGFVAASVFVGPWSNALALLYVVTLGVLVGLAFGVPLLSSVRSWREAGRSARVRRARLGLERVDPRNKPRADGAALDPLDRALLDDPDALDTHR